MLRVSLLSLCQPLFLDIKSENLVAEVKNALHFPMWLSLTRKLLLMLCYGDMFLQQETKCPHFFPHGVFMCSGFF